MDRKHFLKSSLLLASGPLIYSFSKPEKTSNMKAQHRLLRHATVLININDLAILVDPMLSPKDAMDPIPNAANNSRIPMVELPFDKSELENLLNKVDAILVTHLHRDHWDVAAQQILNKNIPIFCQPGDADKIRLQGFKQVTAVVNEENFKGLKITRTGGHHGTGEVEKKMGNVSGFVLKNSKDCIYIAGDTIWCDEVKNALHTHKPALTIVNTGAPQYLTGGPITMTAEDVIMVCRELPSTKVVAVHMETINHCTINRAQLKAVLEIAGLAKQVLIPKDGAFF